MLAFLNIFCYYEYDNSGYNQFIKVFSQILNYYQINLKVKFAILHNLGLLRIRQVGVRLCKRAVGSTT